jgi:hypothetical protein
MKHTSLIRFGGLAAMVGSAIFAVNGSLFIDWRKVGFGFASVSGFLFLLSTMAVMVAIHLLHRKWERYGSGGTRAFFAAFVGVALTVGGSYFSEFMPDKAGIGHLLFLTGDLLLVPVGVLVATVGILRLAVVTLRVGVLPRWGGVALFAGNPIVALGIYILSLIFSYLGHPSIWFWLVALPWIAVGLAVFLAAGRRTEQPSRAL